MTQQKPRGVHGTQKTGAVPSKEVGAEPPMAFGKRVAYGVVFAIWTVAAFIGAQLLVAGCMWVFAQMNVALPVYLDETVLQTVVSVVIYVVTIILAVGVPWRLFRQKLTWKDVGLEQRLPTWRDVGLAPLVFVASLILSGIVLALVSVMLPDVDMTTKQQVGFDNLTQRHEMMLAFFTLVVLAPICEEFLFRGYLYGRVRQYYNAFWTVLLTSVVFGLMHVYAGPDLPLQWNAVIGTTALAVCIGALREYTGGIWAGILVHMLKNGVAFFILFVAPLLGMSLVQ